MTLWTVNMSVPPFRRTHKVDVQTSRLSDALDHARPIAAAVFRCKEEKVVVISAVDKQKAPPPKGKVKKGAGRS